MSGQIFYIIIDNVLLVAFAHLTIHMNTCENSLHY